MVHWGPSAIVFWTVTWLFHEQMRLGMHSAERMLLIVFQSAYLRDCEWRWFTKSIQIFTKCGQKIFILYMHINHDCKESRNIRFMPILDKCYDSLINKNENMNAPLSFLLTTVVLLVQPLNWSLLQFAMFWSRGDASSCRWGFRRKLKVLVFTKARGESMRNKLLESAAAHLLWVWRWEMSKQARFLHQVKQLLFIYLFIYFCSHLV